MTEALCVDIIPRKMQNGAYARLDSHDSEVISHPQLPRINGVVPIKCIPVTPLKQVTT